MKSLHFFFDPHTPAKSRQSFFALCKSKSLKPKNVLTLTKLGLMIFSPLWLLYMDSVNDIKILTREERKAIWRDIQETVG